MQTSWQLEHPDRRRTAIRVLLVCALIGLLCAHASAGVRRDRTAPTFAGLKSATTCIPGPVGGERKAAYRLAWAPARDNVTPTARLRYDVYQATTPGGERFSAPTYTTPRGATTFTTPALASGETYYFVVRARDAAGNRDRNRRERPGQNLCL